MRLTRRQAIELIGAAAAGGWAGSAAGDAAIPSLGDAAAARGLLYGATPETHIADASRQFAELFARQCRLLAPVLAWSSSPRPDVCDFGRWEHDVAFARARGLRITGSHLLWHEWLPAWFEAIPDRPAAERAVAQHIAAVTSRFADVAYSWNVVNEAIEVRDGRPDGLRAGMLLEKLGPDYIEFAFRAARESAPRALLLYNDSNFAAPGPEVAARRRALLRLLDRLRARGTPIDGVGLQCHLRLSKPFDEKSYGAFLHEIADRSLRIVITELDVLDLPGPADDSMRDRAVADRYARLLSVALANRAVAAVVTWGLSDRYSWLDRSAKPLLDVLERRSPRPLPFDADFRPKPAFYALLRAFENAPPR